MVKYTTSSLTKNNKPFIHNVPYSCLKYLFFLGIMSCLESSNVFPGGGGGLSAVLWKI